MDSETSDLTPFVESNALLAIVRDDVEEATRILYAMTPYELGALRKHARELAERCGDAEHFMRYGVHRARWESNGRPE